MQLSPLPTLKGNNLNVTDVNKTPQSTATVKLTVGAFHLQSALPTIKQSSMALEIGHILLNPFETCIIFWMGLSSPQSPIYRCVLCPEPSIPS